MLLHRLTNENENDTTELLANLMKRKYIRDAVVRFLFSSEGMESSEVTQKTLDEIKETDVSTQVPFLYQGQPDLIISSKNLFVLLENKILNNRGLTEHEIVDYVQIVGGKQVETRSLIFLVPRGYSYMNEIQAINKIEGVSINIRYWENLILLLKRLEIDSPIMNEAIMYFEKVIEIDNRQSTSLNSYEVACMFSVKEVFDFMGFQEKFAARLKAIKPSVIRDLNMLGKGCFKDNGSSKSIDSIGEFLLFGKKGSLFYGLSNPNLFPKEYQNSHAYSICFYSEGFDSALLRTYPSTPEGKWVWYCIPLFDENYRERDFIDEENDVLLKDQIVRIIRMALDSIDTVEAQ